MELTYRQRFKQYYQLLPSEQDVVKSLGELAEFEMNLFKIYILYPDSTDIRRGIKIL